MKYLLIVLFLLIMFKKRKPKPNLQTNGTTGNGIYTIQPEGKYTTQIVESFRKNGVDSPIIKEKEGLKITHKRKRKKLYYFSNK